ncbi:putative g2 mitotic-specific cyclin protein [Lasiodiplodia theobromae]|uniref:G2/mitotic-specific cyclin-4 n=1 Tax=Lasiodiplodia theobromae TaxID=45133 RepID=A0A5N5DKM4_9PEZI|nr:G2 mitotic-specific cyclin [Lasiodiplodia theobromae]KAB2578435.1 G2/mitotic-specific cyclin-4 [Lasiodiplodia theobromae]KAF4544805.1 G2 mitotic-specific cyclin [Lasiodiplodia theobromae]KAF9637825.1 putative g2 mitotic-specific cyclin protein [Lasiodiplodia theobromae]
MDAKVRILNACSLPPAHPPPSIGLELESNLTPSFMHADSSEPLPTPAPLRPMDFCLSEKLIRCREQPQRPLRSLRVHNENSVPAAPAGKTIHQRNKSTPALSSLAQNAGIKAAAKRTAFADVSNTTRNTHLAKDEPVAAKKDVLAPIQEATKPAAILRPAQRPLSSIAQKPAVAEPVAPKTSVAEIAPQPLHTKKTIPKRSTTVFKENAAPVDAEPVRRRERSNTAPQLSPPSEKLHKVESIVEKTVEESVTLSSEESTTSLETAIAAEECHQIAGLDADLPEEDDALPVTEDELAEISEKENDDAEQEEQDAKAEAIALAEAERFEEYWDEEDEEYYDADGYTGYTTRSLRNRTDNTTGGVTVVLAPRVTARTRRELEEAAMYVDATKTTEDIEDEAWDTSMVAEYGDEIFDYMRKLEDRMRPNPFYMDNQSEIQWSMRSVLMDWLVQVHHRFTLLPETLFLAVNYVDRFLSCKVVSLGKLQLVGATAIFVAAKYEEINCPSVSEIVYMVDGGYTVDEILKAERFMLSMLQFELGWPGPMSFLRRISKADDYDLETRTLAKYFLEITIMDERFVGCVPSFLAAGAHCLARFMLKKGDWSKAHVHYSGYTWSQLRSLVSVMLECSEHPQKHHAAVFEKYADKRYKRASLFVEAEIQKGFQLPQQNHRDSFGTGSWLRK